MAPLGIGRVSRGARERAWHFAITEIIERRFFVRSRLIQRSRPATFRLLPDSGVADPARLGGGIDSRARQRWAFMTGVAHHDDRDLFLVDWAEHRGGSCGRH